MISPAITTILQETHHWLAEYYQLVEGKTVPEFLQEYPTLRTLQGAVDTAVLHGETEQVKTCCRAWLMEWRAVLRQHTGRPHPHQRRT